MDFKERILRSYPEEFTTAAAGRVPLPFYMTYPYYTEDTDNTSIVRDLEYLQQMYPTELKKYQRKIMDILDKMDYEGSMIYDEYPDRASVRRLAESIFDILKKEETGNTDISDKEWEKIGEIVQILLCNEIYKRRHGRKRTGFIKL
jgi:hypothetical protein